ncbi:LOW QUALITY PROTEIN: hypothetical protein M8C21_010025, partial [Ambrosia artemisiifolia]
DKQLKSAFIKHIDKEILAKHKKKEREAAKQGKQPYYLKKSEIPLLNYVELFRKDGDNVARGLKFGKVHAKRYT